MTIITYGASTIFALLATLVMVAQHLLIGSPASWLTIFAPILVVEGSMLSHIAFDVLRESWRHRSSRP